MKNHEIKFKNQNIKYSIIIGNNILSSLKTKIRRLCPKTKKIALVIDKKVPKVFKIKLKKILKKYDITFIDFNASEKQKSLKIANLYLKKLLKKNFNRSDLVISVGGGITGDLIGFVASIFKRGINFINVPTTLLAQADAAIGGKTGVNSVFGKNLIGSFYQPKLVINDTAFLKSLPRKELICGYAEILKHSIIKDKKLFIWLKKNTRKLLSKDPKKLIYAIKKSCEIKLFFVNKDVNEKDLRMILNFGHTFAHAIEVKNNYSKNILHGEAVLSGMVLAARLSNLLKICNNKTLEDITEIYKSNKLTYTIKKYSNYRKINELLPFLLHDKKNDNDKINFILLKKIGQTTMPNKFKISKEKVKNLSQSMALY